MCWATIEWSGSKNVRGELFLCSNIALTLCLVMYKKDKDCDKMSAQQPLREKPANIMFVFNHTYIVHTERDRREAKREKTFFKTPLASREGHITYTRSQQKSRNKMDATKIEWDKVSVEESLEGRKIKNAESKNNNNKYTHHEESARYAYFFIRIWQSIQYIHGMLWHKKKLTHNDAVTNCSEIYYTKAGCLWWISEWCGCSTNKSNDGMKQQTNIHRRRTHTFHRCDSSIDMGLQLPQIHMPRFGNFWEFF